MNRKIKQNPAEEQRQSRIALHMELLKLSSLLARPMRKFVAAEHGLQLDDLKIIVCLLENRELTSSELAERVGLSPMSANRALGRLRGRQLVDEQGDVSDRRRRPVRLSPAGYAAWQEILPSMGEVAELAYGQFSQAELDELLRMVRSILRRRAIADAVGIAG